MRQAVINEIDVTNFDEVGDLRDRPDLAAAPSSSSDTSDARPGVLGLGAPRVTVVIPAMNEARNLPHVLPRIPTWVYEVMLVDGNSTDDTVAVARQLWPGIRIVAQQGKGKGAALRTGFSAATGEIVVMLDADGSTDPAEIPVYVGALMAGADFAKGSRFMQGGGTSDISRFRQLGNWGLTQLVTILFGGNFSDLCYGYNAFWTDTIRSLGLDGDGFEIETMMNVRALRAGLRISEVPSFEAERVYGESRLRAIPDGWRVLKTIVREWRTPPVRQVAIVPARVLPDIEKDHALTDRASA
jgi:glycosyltransferase involved in cell wall biosynthesis